MRIVLDTNIYISAFTLRSQRMLALIDAITAKHTIVLPSYVLDELLDVVRQKFPLKIHQTEMFLRELPYEPFETPDDLNEADYPKINDPKDLPVLASAILADADVLLSGNGRHFGNLDIRRPEPLTPAQFLEKYGVR